MGLAIRSLGGFALLLTLLFGTVGTTSAAHLGNNKADLAGTGDPDARGQAIVNFSKGTGAFNGRVSVRSLTPDGTYTFLVRTAAGAEQTICMGAANSRGTFACNAQGLILPGFVTAVIRDSAGVEVASALFQRRGNCRAPDQAGSQCGASGHTH